MHGGSVWEKIETGRKFGDLFVSEASLQKIYSDFSLAPVTGYWENRKKTLETTAGTFFLRVAFLYSYSNTKYRLIFIPRYVVLCFQFRSLTYAGLNSSLVTSRAQIVMILPQSTQTRSLRHPRELTYLFSRTTNLPFLLYPRDKTLQEISIPHDADGNNKNINWTMY